MRQPNHSWALSPFHWGKCEEEGSGALVEGNMSSGSMQLLCAIQPCLCLVSDKSFMLEALARPNSDGWFRMHNHLLSHGQIFHNYLGLLGPQSHCSKNILSSTESNMALLQNLRGLHCVSPSGASHNIHTASFSITNLLCHTDCSFVWLLYYIPIPLQGPLLLQAEHKAGRHLFLPDGCPEWYF